MEDERNDEDRIIESLIMAASDDAMYDDTDFLPVKISLYNEDKTTPDYDADISGMIRYIILFL